MAKALKKPVWLKYTEDEVKEIIFRIAEKNPELTSEKIGLILRDTYGIPKVDLYGLKISKVLKEKNIYINPDEKNIHAKQTALLKHLLNNKGDKTAGRSLIKTKSKVKKIKEYFSK